VERKVEKLRPARLIYALFKNLPSGVAALALGIVLLSAPLAEAKPSRYAAIIVDADTGKVLQATSPDRRSYPASLTKVMTLYLLFDALEQGRLRMDSLLPVSAHAAGQAPSKLGLRPGDEISVQEAILALVTKSANDVAVVIAEALGGSENGFAVKMTQRAHAIGMVATTYRNASGLPNLGQVSTPRDQAILARAIIRDHAHYYRYFATRSFDWRGQTISSHNRLMLNYAGADGLKTGYINASGFNLIASAVRDGHRLVGVVFGGDTAAWRDHRMAQLLDRGFAQVASGMAIQDVADEVEAEPAPVKPAVVKAKAKAKAVKLAAAKAAKAAADDTEGDSTDDDSWGIQVGAFAASKPAHAAAAAAAKKLGGLIFEASVDVDRVRGGRYRARLTGFTEDQARAACRKLAKSHRECRVVNTGA
jgi:D-alanyl-D-alanine carboxypeptidase